MKGRGLSLRLDILGRGGLWWSDDLTPENIQAEWEALVHTLYYKECSRPASIADFLGVSDSLIRTTLRKAGTPLRRGPVPTYNVIHCGDCMPLIKAAELAGISYSSCVSSMERGSSAQEAFDRAVDPKSKIRRPVKYKGEEMSLSAAVRAAGLPSAGGVYWRVQEHGKTFQEAFDEQIAVHKGGS